MGRSTMEIAVGYVIIMPHPDCVCDYSMLSSRHQSYSAELCFLSLRKDGSYRYYTTKNDPLNYWMAKVCRRELGIDYATYERKSCNLTAPLSYIFVESTILRNPWRCAVHVVHNIKNQMVLHACSKHLFALSSIYLYAVSQASTSPSTLG